MTQRLVDSTLHILAHFRLYRLRTNFYLIFDYLRTSGLNRKLSSYVGQFFNFF